MDVLSDDLGSQYSSICTEEILNDDSIIRFGIEDTFSKVYQTYEASNNPELKIH